MLGLPIWLSFSVAASPSRESHRLTMTSFRHYYAAVKANLQDKPAGSENKKIDPSSLGADDWVEFQQGYGNQEVQWSPHFWA